MKANGELEAMSVIYDNGRVVLEGTKEQMKNLLLIYRLSELDLPKIRTDYQVDNLWCTEDVLSNYDCSEEDAMECLEIALQNTATMEQIWLSINYAARDMELKEL